MQHYFFLTVLFLASLSSWADGKVISPLKRMPSIPDQQAVLIWDEKTKTETLAIETRFEAQDQTQRYCWLIPTPDKPAIKAAPQGLMQEQADALYAHKDRNSIGSGIFSFSILILLLTLYAVSQTPKGVSRAMRIRDAIVIGFILFILASMILPALGTARNKAARTSVIVHNQSVIDGVEITTLEASKIDDLMLWFKQNDYHVADSMRSCLSELLKENWYISACRLEQVPHDKVSPKCLQFTFKTDKPVYPMRLTGVDADLALKLRLFIAGPGNARVEGMHLIAATQAKTNELGPALRMIIPPNSQVSALEGTISIQAMQKDMPIHFDAAEQKYLVIRNENKINSLYLITLIWIAIFFIPCYKKPKTLKYLALPAILALAFIPNHFGKDHYLDEARSNRFYHRNAYQTLRYIEETIELNEATSLKEARQALKKPLKDEGLKPHFQLLPYELTQTKPGELNIRVFYGLLGNRRFKGKTIKLKPIKLDSPKLNTP